jgi:hypothetical protein
MAKQANEEADAEPELTKAVLRAGLGRGTSQDDRESVVRRGVVHFM